MLKKSFLKHGGQKNEQMALQITSMADIFVIILVFLLKSYSVEGLPHEQTIAVSPPMAKGKVDLAEALKLEVGKDAFALGGEKVGAMQSFRFAAKDLDSDGASQSLRRALSKAYSSQEKGKESAKLLVIADEGAPYETIKAVLASAAVEGYVDVQLAVSNAN